MPRPQTAFFGLGLGALLIAGCSNPSAAPVPPTQVKPAPLPASATPEQRQAYEQAIKNSQPPTGK